MAARIGVISTSLGKRCSAPDVTVLRVVFDPPASHPRFRTSLTVGRILRHAHERPHEAVRR